MSDADDEPPLPTDHDAWRSIVERGQLAGYSEERIVAAIQSGFKKEGVDQRYVGAMINFVSDRMMRILRHEISAKRFPNEGRDIVETAHNTLLHSMLSPGSADGKALCKWFWPTLRNRAIDHIRPVLTVKKNTMDIVDDPGDLPDPQTQLFSKAEQEAHVQLLLNRIRDARKREAFKLHMDGVPFGGHKGNSIADLMKISPETASAWVKDVQEQLAKMIGNS